jgi:hypothetical protein
MAVAWEHLQSAVDQQTAQGGVCRAYFFRMMISTRRSFAI